MFSLVFESPIEINDLNLDAAVDALHAVFSGRIWGVSFRNQDVVVHFKEPYTDNDLQLAVSTLQEVTDGTGKDQTG